MKKSLNTYPKGWNEKKIKALVEHYERQTEDDEVAEDERAFNDPGQTVMLVPHELVPAVNRLLATHGARKHRAGSPRRKPRQRAARRRAKSRAHAA